MRQRLMKDDHPDVSMSLNSMAVSFERLGDNIELIMWILLDPDSQFLLCHRT